MIRMHHVTKRYGRAAAVDDLSLEIPEGQSIALWGANGAGKSTLIRCVLGLLRFRGEIRVAGHDVRRRGKSARLMIGYVPQELGFYDELRAWEAIRYFGRLKGVSVGATEGALASVGLVGHEWKRIRELSGGMKQRLALAIALLGDPPVLVLDEVTASLDAVGRAELVGLLEGLAGSGRTLLFASHRAEEVAALADRVVSLKSGRVVGVMESAEFAATIGGETALHLMIAPQVRQRALAALRDSGYDARLNGVGLIVPVSPESKAGPFCELARADIAVHDFELIVGGRHHAADGLLKERP